MHSAIVLYPLKKLLNYQTNSQFSPSMLAIMWYHRHSTSLIFGVDESSSMVHEINQFINSVSSIDFRKRHQYRYLHFPICPSIETCIYLFYSNDTLICKSIFAIKERNRMKEWWIDRAKAINAQKNIELWSFIFAVFQGGHASMNGLLLLTLSQNSNWTQTMFIGNAVQHALIQ